MTLVLAFDTATEAIAVGRRPMARRRPRRRPSRCSRELDARRAARREHAAAAVGERAARARRRSTVARPRRGRRRPRARARSPACASASRPRRASRTVSACRCTASGTLDAIARRFADHDGLVGVVGDAMRQEVYPALFRCGGGRVTRLGAGRGRRRRPRPPRRWAGRDRRAAAARRQRAREVRGRLRARRSASAPTFAPPEDVDARRARACSPRRSRRCRDAGPGDPGDAAARLHAPLRRRGGRGAAPGPSRRAGRTAASPARGGAAVSARIRAMRRADLAAVLAIERASLPEPVVARALFVDELDAAGHARRGSSRTRPWGVVGFGGLMQNDDGRAHPRPRRAPGRARARDSARALVSALDRARGGERASTA